MLKLLKKDLLINYRHHLLSLVIVVAGLLLLQLESNDYSAMGLYACLIATFAYLVGQSAYMDDKGISGSWLRTLPVKPHQIIDAKYLLALLTTVEGFLLYLGTQFVSASVRQVAFQMSASLFTAILGLHLVYCGLFLFLFYKYGFSVAQYSIALVAFLLILTKMIGSEKFFKLPVISSFNALYGIAGLGLLVFLMSWLYTRRNFPSS